MAIVRRWHQLPDVEWAIELECDGTDDVYTVTERVYSIGQWGYGNIIEIPRAALVEWFGEEAVARLEKEGSA